MNDSLSELARKIRSKKLKKEEIENYKKEAIESKMERERRLRLIIKIQRFVRGHLSRKKFKIFEDKININTIIEYLHEKKVKRIHKHSPQIISYFVYKYIDRQRKLKSKLINEYRAHCSDTIKAFIRGIILRKKIKNDLDSIRNSKKIISPYILSFKTRLMLKCDKIQNILVDIANIKFLLKDEKEQNQSEEEKQNIKELKMKLRKKYNEFYLIYYQNKMTSEWVDEKRTTEPWFKRYLKIINGEDVSIVKSNNYIDKNIYDNKKEKKGPKKSKNFDNFNNIDLNEYDYSKNTNNNINYEIYSNTNEYSNSNMNINDNYQNKAQNQKAYFDDERPIKPMKNNNYINSENPFGLGENGYPKDHNYFNNNINNINNQKGKEYQKSKIRRNKEQKNQNNAEDNSYQINKKPEEKQFMNKENQLSNNINNNTNNNIINNNQYNEYDERPIGTKKIDYNEMFSEGQNFEGDAFGGMNKDMNINPNPNQKKVIKNKNSQRKKPVYDARKAIEEAKIREAKEGKKEKTSAFREFVKEMKKISAEEKAENNPKNIEGNNNLPKVKKYGKDDLPLKKNNYIEENSNYTNNINEGEQSQEQKVKIIPIRGRKNETKDMIMRRKLHELERSPPPVLNIKDVKSKIECWGPSNDIKNQKILQYNNEKENKKNKNTKNNKSKYQKELKDSNNIHSINKKSMDISQDKINKIIDPVKIEEKAQKIAGKKLARIENQINRIESEFSLENYFKDKELKMKEYGDIPYIKKEYNYVKKYSNDVYNTLVTHLLAQYQDLK